MSILMLKLLQFATDENRSMKMINCSQSCPVMKGLSIKKINI